MKRLPEWNTQGDNGKKAKIITANPIFAQNYLGETQVGPRPPSRAELQQQQTTPSIPSHWQQSWIDAANTVIPLYGFTTGLPAFRTTIFTPGLGMTDFTESRNMRYPSEEEMSVFRSFRDNEIYKKWIGIYMVGEYRERPDLGTRDVEAWINKDKNYPILFRYFNANCFQKLNFFGLSTQPIDRDLKPAYFQEPVQAPQTWKNMMIILFTQAMIENHLWRDAPIIKFEWLSGPPSFSQPTLKELKFATVTFTWLQPSTHGDEVIISILKGYGHMDLLFPNNPSKNAVKFTKKLHDESKFTFFDSYLIGPNLDGFQTWENLLEFCNLVYASYRSELSQKLSPEAFRQLNGDIAEIKTPNYGSIFEAMRGKTRFAIFKMLWQSTVAGNTWLDYFAAKWSYRPVPSIIWPPKGDVALLHEGDNVAREQPAPLMGLEKELYDFMIHHPPYRLHVPKIANFWTLDRRSDEWLEVFEQQWQDYYKWCYNNVIAKMNNPKQYIEPGKQLKNKKGELLTVLDQKGIAQPLINTYPDYGIMDKSPENVGSYWEFAVIALPITKFIYGDEFWPMVTGFIKRVFTEILNALVELARIVLELAWGLIKTGFEIPDLGYFALIAVGIGALVIGGGSFVSQVGTRLAGG